MSNYLLKHKYHFGTLIILLIIAGISWYIDLNIKNTDEITNNKLQITNKISNDKSQTPKKYPISNIQYQDDVQTPNPDSQIPTITSQVISYKLQVTTTSTALETMRNAKLDFKTKTFSGLGEFVEEIGGLKNDPQGGKYWIYFINGETAKLGISTQIVKPNDLIEWKYGTTNL
ncbi:MAG: DUF4430 domain-containing protein [Patescibacteria group bacterium]